MKPASRPATAGPRTRRCVSVFVLVSSVAQPFVGDANTADKTGVAVDDEDLAMRAVVCTVELRDLLVGERSEPAKVATCPFHHRNEAVVELSFGERVDEHANTAATVGRSGERPSELVGNMAGPEYERDDVDCAFGVVDRIDHRSENFVAVAQYLDRVALCGVQSEKRMHAIDPFTGGCRYS
jgi:hypothetical protein